MTTIILLSSLAFLILVIGIFFITSYNKLVGAKELIENSRGQIAAQIESRFDALTSLISATKQYTAHEAETIEKTVKQRTSLSSDMSNADYEKAEEIFQGSLSRLIAISENYPELKASEVYKQSMDSIDKYEKNVRLSRMSYNDTVTKYNRLVITIPTNIVASMTGHTKEEYFKSQEEKKDMPVWD